MPKKLFAEKGIKQSMSRRVNCWDNAPLEYRNHLLNA